VKHRYYKLLFLVLSILFLTSCRSFLPVHYPPIQQGNFIHANKVAQVQRGMSEELVLGIMGTPVYDNTFESNTWVYVYTFQKQNQPMQRKRVIIQFRNGEVSRISKNLPLKTDS